MAKLKPIAFTVGIMLVTYLLLFAALMLIIGWEKRFFRRAAPQIAKEIA